MSTITVHYVSTHLHSLLTLGNYIPAQAEMIFGTEYRPVAIWNSQLVGQAAAEEARQLMTNSDHRALHDLPRCMINGDVIQVNDDLYYFDTLNGWYKFNLSLHAA